ncbi:MAG: hypothetical protein H8E35_10055 [Ardenticatenia bacterium]|nr:hypothetical protein [Ardenticatenia bacterium]
MKAIRKPIGITILIGMLFVAACSLPFTNGAKAKELAREYVEARLVKCGDSYNHFELSNRSFSGGGMNDPVYWQYKGLVLTVHAARLDLADKANGVEWHGYVEFDCEMVRTHVDGRWSEWSSICSLPFMETVLPLRKQNGQWMTGGISRGWVSLPVPPKSPPRFTCDDVPK